MIDMSGLIFPKGTIRLVLDELETLRRQCFERDGYLCKRCRRGVSWETGHMAHIKSRGAGGTDTLENIRTLCAECHRREHQGK